MRQGVEEEDDVFAGEGVDALDEEAMHDEPEDSVVEMID